ncbi:uncharacterized protein LOC122243458 [Penaeus japonicus]|uniref:uncharacterized protein LOC122243458 n=1 Tax=Penaeus japonicus TaxID=27405 RepID=UPI001C71196C|nr:uncharacterized protein LOC122243458 [Penaeus japonicus]
MKIVQIAVSIALLCSQTFAAISYLGVAQGTPLGGFSQHSSFHGGFIPGGLYGNGVPIVNHGLSGGYLPGPIYSNGGSLDYTYGSDRDFGSIYGNGRLDNPYNGLGNVRTDGIDEAEDDRSSTSGSESVQSTDGQNLGSIQTGVSGLHLSPVAALGNFPFDLGARDSFVSGFPSAVGPYTSIPGLSGFPYGLHPHTSSLGSYPYGLGSLSSISGLGGLSYGAGAHASVAGLGGFPYDITHDASVAGLSQQYGFLPNVGAHIPVGAVGGFPYGLGPHIPFSGLYGYPLGPEPVSVGGLGGLHSGLGPYTSVADLSRLSPDFGLHTAGPRLSRLNSGRGSHNPSAALKSLHSGFGSRRSSNVSSENKDKKDKN